MKKITRRNAIKLTAVGLGGIAIPAIGTTAQKPAKPFGTEFPNLESLTTGKWWDIALAPNNQTKSKGKGGATPAPSMKVARDKVIAFALYAHHNKVLKITAQLFPLMPEEEETARLELMQEGQWKEVAKAEVLYPGWDAHFRIENWDNSKDVAYRIRHGEKASFEGLIRKDPIDKNEIIVANMSCNSSRTIGLRPEIIENLKLQNPDMLFFGGDQTYRHTEHTAGWIEFGLQFRDIIRDRPTLCIPDDHDVGHGNVWGENGKKSITPGDADGGYRYPVDYVNQVQRQQSWNLPDPVDPAPVDRGIKVYFTRITIGEIDFAILEDRKFKTGPDGKIPKMGPRPDHINDPKYDPKTIDLPNLQLLGKRQEKFLDEWTQDWTGTQMKAVLSQTAFCGAVHMHGGRDSRLLADLDCNGWPQTPRNRALELIRKAWAVHLCGDQHLAVVVKHGVKDFGDGPYAFTSPALVNTIYGRWWHPLDEKAGPNPVKGCSLPWTGDFNDGLGNKISMLAYANPEDITNEKKRADGYGLVRFNKKLQTVTFECWPRFSRVKEANEKNTGQFPGWPITINTDANDGRKIVGYLPELVFEKGVTPVVQVMEEKTGEVLYTVRSQTSSFKPRVYAQGKYTVNIGRNKPDEKTLKGLEITSTATPIKIKL